METDEGSLRYVQLLVWHSFAPVLPSIRPPQVWDLLEGEKYIFGLLIVPSLVLFEFDGVHLSCSF